jgi:hypothetical protein
MWLGEDAGEGVEELLQQSVAGGGRVQPWSVWSCHPVPADLAFVPLERHGVSAEIPEDGAQRRKPLCAEDDIITYKGQDEEIGGEHITVDAERGSVDDAEAGDTLAVGDRGCQAGPVL